MMVRSKPTALGLMLYGSLICGSTILIAELGWANADTISQQHTQMAQLVQLVGAARARTQLDITYNGAYRRLSYPGGDVPDHLGVCTDLVVRAYRELNIDLQRLVHEDMRTNFTQYPPLWGLTRPDRNIDHRRVPNLATFFSRHGERLPISQRGTDYQPGDIVTWRLAGNLPHIGIVSDRQAKDPASSTASRPLIIHNVGSGPKEEDRLFHYQITGHYRYYRLATSDQPQT